jgi:hypothetical protein
VKDWLAFLRRVWHNPFSEEEGVMAKKSTNTSNTAGTASAGKKRSLARRFNDSLTLKAVKTSTAKPLDKRTARRLERYRSELKTGKSPRGQGLTPLDVAMRIDELLTHGAKLADLRKLIKPRAAEFDQSALVDILKEMHPIYRYRADAYRFAGVSNEALLAAGIIEKLPARRGPKPVVKEADSSKKGVAKKRGKAT